MSWVAVTVVWTPYSAVPAIQYLTIVSIRSKQSSDDTHKAEPWRWHSEMAVMLDAALLVWVVWVGVGVIVSETWTARICTSPVGAMQYLVAVLASNGE